MQHFLNAAEDREIIFTRGTTEAINLVAHSYGRPNLQPGDEIIVSAHGAPLQHRALADALRARRGATLKVVPIDDERRAAAWTSTRSCWARRPSWSPSRTCPTRWARSTRSSEIIELAHAQGVPVLLDGCPGGPAPGRSTCRSWTATSTPSPATSCTARPASACSTARRSCWRRMPPYQGGGDMIRPRHLREDDLQRAAQQVRSRHAEHRRRRRAGRRARLPANLGLRQDRRARAATLLAYATERLCGDPRRADLIGTATHKASVLSFTLEGAHPHDVGTMLDRQAIAVRTGHHCAQPLMERFGVAGHGARLVRPLQHREEIEALASALRRVKEIFG